MYPCVNVCVCAYSPTSTGSLSLFSSDFKLFLRIWSHSLPSADSLEFDSRFLCHLWRTNPEFGIGALQIFLCSSPPHTPFWSWCKRHCWFPSKLVSVPEAFKTSNLWRILLWEALPPLTTAIWEFSSLMPQPLSIPPFWACWTVETHRRWILPPTRSRTRWLRWQAWKRSFGPVKRSLRSQIKFCIQRTIFNITNIQFFHFFSLPHSDMWWCYRMM